MIVFNYTLFKKFWKCISESNKTESIHGMLHRCKEQELITIDEYHEIFSSPFDNLACAYANAKLNEFCMLNNNYDKQFEYPNNGMVFCEFCPFDIKNPNNSCLDGLYHKWALLNYSTGKENLLLYQKLANEIMNFKLKENIDYE